MGDWFNVIFGVLLTAGTAVFVATEFSLVTIDSATLGDDDDAEGDSPGPARADDAGTVAGARGATGSSAMKKNADWRTRILRNSLKHLSTELSSSQVGITLTTILLGYTAQPALARLLSDAFGTSPVTAAFSGVLAGTIAFIAVNLFSMLFGELVPKNFALSAPLGTARLVAPIQRVFTIGAGPVIAVLNGSANAILRRMGIEPKEELSSARSPRELAFLVQRSAEQGTLDVSVAQLITNAVDFEELTAADVMTDRMRMQVLSKESTAQEVIDYARETGHSRFPVIGESRDDILGFVHLRRAIAVPYDKRGTVPAMAIVDEAPQVPETVTLGALLVELRGFGQQMAVVVDEYGGTAGIVTLEDVVEELVGDVADEHDARRSGVLLANDGTWGLPGLLRPDELTERTGITVPQSDDYETLGGLIMAELGQVPVVGSTVRVPASRTGPDGVLGVATLRVEAMDGRRVERVRLRLENGVAASRSIRGEAGR